MTDVDVPCPECGFVYSSITPADAPDAFRTFAKRYRIPLTRGLRDEDLDALLRAHPLDGTWSALEYACHVRDLLVVQRNRIAAALEVDLLDVQPMRRDDIVTERDYNGQDPAGVAEQLAMNAEALAGACAALSDANWEHPLVYHDKGKRTIAWVAQHTVHEGEHHLLDIGRVLRAARGR